MQKALEVRSVSLVDLNKTEPCPYENEYKQVHK